MNKNARNRRLFVTAVLAVAAACSFPAHSQAPVAELRGQVLDEDAQPVARVEIVQANAATGTEPVYTDAAGRFQIDFPAAGPVVLSFSKPGFFRMDNKQIDLTPGINEVAIPLSHETELQQNVEVHSTSTQIDPETTSHEETVVRRQMIDIPVPTDRDVQQSLTTMPQVLADASGRLHVAGARQGQTEVLLDGFEINDPGTGAFNARMNVDAVQDVSVQTGGYGAEYAHAGAGVLAIDTVTGDDRLRFGVTNFVPGLNFQSAVHFGNWYPRITFSGPFKKGKAWFSEAVTGQRTFHLVTELPAGQNTEVQWGGDNLFRVQVSLASWNTLQGSFLFNKADDARAGLGPYSPVLTTTSSESGRYFLSVKDQLFLGHTVFDFGAAYDAGSQSNTPHGAATYVVSPSNTSGDYFQQTAQQSRRLQGIGNITASSLHWFGEHTLSAGWNVSGVNFSQISARNQIDYVRADGTLSDQTSFLGSGAVHLADTQLGGYVQDHWRPFKPLMLSAGLRADWDRLIHRSLIEPRLAMNWVPSKDGSMKFTLAWGIHYQPLNLQILSQGFDQQRSDLDYDSTGVVPMLPPTVTTFVVPLGKLLQPRSYNTTVQWDYKVSPGTYVGAAFLLREGRDGFAYQTASPPGTFLLQNNRNDRYVSGETWVRHSFGDRAEISVDYTRSRATSSQVFDPTPTQLIFSSQGPGPVLWDSPNRLVATGSAPIPIWELFLSGFFEYHTGFPFSSINQVQQLVGAPNSMRFPNYLSLDLGLEKRFTFHRHQWAIRVSGINITGHNNPDSVVNNIDAPNYLSFAGGRTLAFTGRLRLVTGAQP
jgi:Carboxypeptidase regulatory-like domain/TonB-dependent Receptor Plug Domain